MTSIKYAHFQVMGTITGKFHQNPLKTVGGVADTRFCLRTDGLTDGWTDGRPITIVPFDLRRGTIIQNFIRQSTYHFQSADKDSSP